MLGHDLKYVGLDSKYVGHDPKYGHSAPPSRVRPSKRTDGVNELFFPHHDLPALDPQARGSLLWWCAGQGLGFGLELGVRLGHEAKQPSAKVRVGVVVVVVVVIAIAFRRV